MAKPQVAIVGRTNVGKSTLFNRLVGERQAVVAEQPGITRDRLYGTAEIEGRSILFVDTGGLFSGDDPLQTDITKHAEIALEEADVVLFLVDGIEGLTSLDYEIAEITRRSGKPYVLAANKMESPKRSSEDFLALRLGQPLDISAAHGAGTADLEEAIYELLPPAEEEEEAEEEDAIRVAIVGRPNVGKSALLNAIAGEERVIVSELPGTTRDAIDVHIEREGKKFVLVDTAGLRRKKKVKQSIEYWSVLRSLRAIDRAHIALIVLDAHEGVTEQDAKIAGYAMESGTGAIVVANKWDLVRDVAREYAEVYADEQGSRRPTARRQAKVLRSDFERQVRRILSFFDYVDIVYTSALEATGTDELLSKVERVAEEHSRRIGTGELNRTIIRAVERHEPPSRKGRPLKIYYATQPRTRPPTIVLFVNDPKLMHVTYKRYIVNSLRKEFGFQGTPIRLLVRARERRSSPHEGGRERPKAGGGLPRS